VLTRVVLAVVEQFLFPFQGAAWNQSYMALCGNDTALMAIHYGYSKIGNAGGQFLVSPVVAGLADRFGRVFFATAGRAGWFVFWMILGQPWMSLRGRMMAEWFCWSISGGVWPVHAAQHSDVFGSRPLLSSQVKTADQVYCQAAAFLANIAGPLMLVRYGVQTVFYASSVLVVILSAVSATMPETLAKKDRKPFRMARSNVLGNIYQLLTNGPGLRKLTLSSTVWFFCNSTNATRNSYAMGVLEWSPTNLSHFSSIFSLSGAASQKFIIRPFLAAFGNRRTFEVGALISALSYLLQAHAWRGGSRAVSAMMFTAFSVLLQTIPAGMPAAMRSMMVAQVTRGNTLCWDFMFQSENPQTNSELSSMICLD